MRGFKLAVLLGSVSMAALAAPAFAADAPKEPDATTVTELVVTAQKRTEPLKEVPMSVTALNGGVLDKIQAVSFADYSVLVPGLSLDSPGQGITRLTLRGQNAGGVGSTVAVYVDESPFGSSTALLNGSILTGDFEAWDMQRIEVLRGPQGTLYGANSEGGLLKFVTNQPVLGQFSGQLEGTLDSVDHGNNGGSVKGVINVPLGDRTAIRVAAYNDKLEGWIQDPNLGLNNVNSGFKDGVRISLLSKPTDQFTIKLSAASQRTKVGGSATEDVDPFTQQPVHGDLSQERFLAEPNTFVYHNYNMTLDYDFGGANLTSATSYGKLDTLRVIDESQAQLAPGVPGAGTYGDYLSSIENGSGFPGVFAVGEQNVADLKKFTQEFRLASAKSNHLEWLVGAYYTHESGNLDQHLTTNQFPSGAPAPVLPELEHAQITSIYKEYAVFGDVTYHFNDQFDIEAGGRYSTNKQTGTENLSGALVGAPIGFSTPSSGDIFTWSLAPRWHVDANTMVYARVATGWRPGGPNVLPPNAPPSVPHQYGADSTVNYEVGVRSTLADGKVNLDFALFRVDWKNIQIFESVNNYGVDANGGKARSQGAEWTVGWRPLDHLNLLWTGAYTQANLTTALPLSDPSYAPAGAQLPFAPKWSTAVDAEYSWRFFDEFDAFAGFTYAYVGKRATDFSTSAFTPNTPFRSEVPSYDTWAARIGVQNDKYRVELWGKNLADTRGFSAYGNSGTPGTNGSVGIIQPRTIGVTVSAKW